jgi:hypothetical protein
VADIRHATLEDVSAIVAMGLRFIRETVYAGSISENPEQMARLATQLIDGDLDGVLFVVDGERGPVGMTGALCFAHPLSGDLSVSELFWWCDEPARGRAGISLLRALTKWARERGAVGLTMIAPTADVERIYDRLGFQRMEVSYLRRF